MLFLEHFKLVPTNDGSIRWGWMLDPSGIYTVSSLRRYIDSSILPQSDGKWAWNPLVPGKLNILAWRISHGKLPTMANLFKFGISQTSACRSCNVAPETGDHIIVGCSISKGVWQQVSKWWRLLDYSFNSAGDLMNCKAKLKGHQRLSKIHEAIMLVYLWVIWNYRNQILHAPSIGSKSTSALAFEVKSLAHLWINARNRKGTLNWLEWCCDPILECYSRIK